MVAEGNRDSRDSVIVSFMDDTLFRHQSLKSGAGVADCLTVRLSMQIVTKSSKMFTSRLYNVKKKKRKKVCYTSVNPF